MAIFSEEHKVARVRPVGAVVAPTLLLSRGRSAIAYIQP